MPTGWRERLVKAQNDNTAAPDGEPRTPRSVRSTLVWCQIRAPLKSGMLAHRRPSSCDAKHVTQVRVPYIVEQREDGAWHASAMLRPGAGAVGEGATQDEATADLRAALTALIAVAGVPDVLTVTVDVG